MMAKYFLRTATLVMSAACVMPVFADHADEIYRLGFTGTGYQRTSDGYERSFVQFLNPAGQAVGYSSRYNGTADNGQSVWLDDGSGPTRLGLTGTGYQRTSDGYEYSVAQSFNAAGQVAGYSYRYDGTAGRGRAPWLDDGSGPTHIGLRGTGYQNADTGYEYSVAYALNEAGQALGYSSRYNGTDYIGRAAWRDDGSGPTRLGFSGTGYQRPHNGWEESFAEFINEAGQAVGWSSRFNGTDPIGRAVWLDDGSGPTRLGFTGTGYRDTSDGFENSYARALNAAGQVVGDSERYSGAVRTGTAVWLDDGSGPIRLGFTGTGYRNTSTGVEESHVEFLNAAGQAVGFSERYSGATFTGRAAWLDDGTGPIRLGLTGTGYQRTSDGYEVSISQFFNEAGQAAGYSNRYSGTAEAGQASWFYDADTDTHSELVFSIRDDGYAYTAVGAMLEDGTVFGVYERYDGMTSLGKSVFAWDMTDGVRDLVELAVSPEGDDWAQFNTVIAASAYGHIIGNGAVAGQNGQSAYLIAPVPEPPLPGDANGDGVVDAFDLAAVEQNFGNTGAADGSLLGDADGDGDVDAFDLTAVEQNFGNTSASPDPLTAASIPEPGSLVMLALVGLTLTCRRR